MKDRPHPSADGDRLVRQLRPSQGNNAKPFSSFLPQRNLVLLGDPGAGKTYVFERFASEEGGERLVARSFLNRPSNLFRRGAVLYIDALDEKRAGRGDQATIDALVAKLFEVMPAKLRIACRAADWLGETDLAALDVYFRRTADCVVVAMEPLTEDERISVLNSQGVADPVSFLREANQRGLDELLNNPQNLVMLAAVVRKGDWPQSRSELFRESVDVLLSEHNPNRIRSESGRYGPSELIDAAGCACAVRLISDVAGISLRETDTEDFPSFRRLDLLEPDKVSAAFGRRVFVSGPENETVDYAHRTIAEYLAALWLAKLVRAGLPLGRVLALIGINGRPASELRGLHAWLAVFLPESAELLIKADPYGVLTYGDAASLTVRLRKVLLEALAELETNDPWFRAGNWSARSAAPLSSKEMASTFRTLLRSPNVGFGLRSVVLDAIAAGTPLPDLLPELGDLFSDAATSYAERSSALDALLRLGEPGRAAICASFPRLGVSNAELRLRSDVLQACYGQGLGASEVATLLRAALETSDSLVGGAFYRLDRGISDGAVGDVLDSLDFSELPRAKERYKNESEVLHVVDRLLIRYLSVTENISGEKLAQWLRKRHNCAEHRHLGYTEELRSALTARPQALTTLLDALLLNMEQTSSWEFLSQLSALTVNAATSELVLSRVMAQMDSAVDRFVYEVALNLANSIGPKAVYTFERLYLYGDSRPELRATREAWCFSEIPEWRIENQQRAFATKEKKEAARSKQLQEFQKSAEKIASANHFGWLAWIADVYFARFSDLDNEVGPNERLTEYLGAENAAIGRNGLIALVKKRQAPQVDEVVRLNSEGRYVKWWLALIAGLDELSAAGIPTDDLPDEFAQSVIAIDCLHPTFAHEGNTSHRIEHPWKIDLIAKRPALVASVYAKLMQAALSKQAVHVDGLYELLDDDAFSEYRSEQVRECLRLFPMAAPQALSRLLASAMAALDPDDLKVVLDNGVCLAEVGSEQSLLWLAAGFLSEPASFEPKLKELQGEHARKVVWAIRDLAGARRRRYPSISAKSLTVEQAEFLIRFVGVQYPKAHHPSDGWSGDTNAWDASDFVKAMIANLSADPAPAAHGALSRLLGDPGLSSYADDLKHARASQQAKQIDAAYKQPGWKAVVETLRSGAPANVADLHALLLDELDDLDKLLRGANTDPYKLFWNVDQWSRPNSPKPEESGRDALVTLLRPRLAPHGVSIEPEGHMARDKRADVVALLAGAKLVMELKRDYHAEVWKAAQTQLERLYTRDPEAEGYGIYGVLWFGSKRPQPIPSHGSAASPTTAQEMKERLEALIPVERRNKISVVVLDVSGAICP